MILIAEFYFKNLLTRLITRGSYFSLLSRSFVSAVSRQFVRIPKMDGVPAIVLRRSSKYSDIGTQDNNSYNSSPFFHLPLSLLTHLFIRSGTLLILYVMSAFCRLLAEVACNHR